MGQLGQVWVVVEDKLQVVDFEDSVVIINKAIMDAVIGAGYWYIGINKLFNINESGFRKRRNALDQLLRLVMIF